MQLHGRLVCYNRVIGTKPYKRLSDDRFMNFNYYKGYLMIQSLLLGTIKTNHLTLQHAYSAPVTSSAYSNTHLASMTCCELVSRQATEAHSEQKVYKAYSTPAVSSK